MVYPENWYLGRGEQGITPSNFCASPFARKEPSVIMGKREQIYPQVTESHHLAASFNKATAIARRSKGSSMEKNCTTIKKKSGGPFWAFIQHNL